MPLPPRGDPRRPLHLAIRSTRLLGGLFVVIGLLALGLPMLYMFRGGGAGPMAITLAVGAMAYLVPGIAYILCAIYLRRRQLWAVIVGIVLASIQLLLVLFGLVGIAVGLANAGSVVPVFLFVYLGLIVLVGVALAQLIYHLARSFEAIKHPPFGEEIRGFEPLPVAPLPMPPPAAGGGPDAAPPGR